MRITVLLASVGILLAGSAFAQTRQNPGTVGAAPAVSTDEFVKIVAVSDMFEIQSSQLALSKQPDADTKPFAEKMVQDHTMTTRELKSLVDSGKVKATLPTALDDAHQKKLDELRAKNGKDFDQAYDQTQLQAHQEAVDLFQKYSASGDNPDLKQWAAKTLPHLREHLAMAQKLK
jgi:putative membrane protein